jgi:hypothetical protein
LALRHPLEFNQARKLISKILAHGKVNLDVQHFLDEAAKDGLDAVDATNVLRGGMIYEPAEEREPGVWRYRVHTQRICVAIEFVDEAELTVITIWRKKAS